MIQYLDDAGWASCNSGNWWRDARLVVGILQSCGFWLGLDQCMLQPVKEMELLGFILNSGKMTIALPVRRILQIQELGELLVQKSPVSLANLRSFCGKIASTEKVLWACRIFEGIVFCSEEICLGDPCRCRFLPCESDRFSA